MNDFLFSLDVLGDCGRGGGDGEEEERDTDRGRGLTWCGPFEPEPEP